MVLSKRYCVEYTDGEIECFRDGFWDSNTGIIVKWSILAAIFLFFMAWFVGGYMHAKRRMRKGLPLMAYHRWLVPYSERRKWGQTPQNHFTFYATQNPYAPGAPNNQPYGRQPDGTYFEPPPMYNSNEASPPGYGPPPNGAAKINPNQNENGMEMPQYGAPAGPPPGYVQPQQTGVVGGQADVESQQQLPARPQQAKTAISNFVSRFKK